MKILIDIGHPADIHQFKNFIWQCENKGYKVLITTREKEFEIELLSHYKFNYLNLGKKRIGYFGKILDLLKSIFKLLIISIQFKPDIFLSHGSITAAITSVIIRKPHISFEDTFNFEQIRLYLPFTKVVLTSDYDHPLKSSKVIKYSGYHELMYLHPNYFNIHHAPDYLNELKSPYIIVRFVAWNATHDQGHTGMTLSNKRKAVNEFEKHGKVLISSESSLPPDLEKYRIQYPAHVIHYLLANASLVFGESATMIAEAAVLGVPGIYIDSTGRFYTKDMEENYGLVYTYSESEPDQIEAINKGVELLQNSNTLIEWKKKRGLLLNNKIDVTAFLVWFVEEYPASASVMKENPDFQKKFK